MVSFIIKYIKICIFNIIGGFYRLRVFISIYYFFFIIYKMTKGGKGKAKGKASKSR